MLILILMLILMLPSMLEDDVDFVVDVDFDVVVVDVDADDIKCPFLVYCSIFCPQTPRPVLSENDPLKI